MSYPQIMKDSLAEGKVIIGVSPLLVGQDGTSYVDKLGSSYNYILSDKQVGVVTLVYTNNDENTVYATATRTSISTNNTDTLVGDIDRYYIAFYTSKNLPYTQTSPKPVVEVEPKVTASNSNSIYKGALIGNQVSGKVQVGNGANGLESKVLDNSEIMPITSNTVLLSPLPIGGKVLKVAYGDTTGTDGNVYERLVLEATGDLSSQSYTNLTYWKDLGKYSFPSMLINSIPNHSTITLDASTSSASKYSKTLEEGSNGLLGGVYGEEITYDGISEWGDTDFSQLTNGTLPDVNGGSAVRTFHGSIPLNIKGK